MFSTEGGVDGYFKIPADASLKTSACLVSTVSNVSPCMSCTDLTVFMALQFSLTLLNHSRPNGGGDYLSPHTRGAVPFGG